MKHRQQTIAMIKLLPKAIRELVLGYADCRMLNVIKTIREMGKDWRFEHSWFETEPGNMTSQFLGQYLNREGFRDIPRTLSDRTQVPIPIGDMIRRLHQAGYGRTGTRLRG